LARVLTCDNGVWLNSNVAHRFLYPCPQKGDKKKEEGEGYDLSKVTLREEDGSLTPMGSFVLDKLDKWEKTPAGRRKLDRLESEWRAELKDAFKGMAPSDWRKWAWANQGAY
jgi:hypothetical protein